MTSQSQDLLVIIACLLILFGMFRLIYVNHPNPNNVNLVRWMFLGGLVELVAGLLKGSLSLLRMRLDQNALGTLAVYLGIFIIWLAL
jgi:hypothetical protein